MAPNPHQRWQEEQITILIDAGIEPSEAQRSTDWVLAHLPPGADPAEWVPSWWQLVTQLDTVDVQDARVDWYASDRIPARFKRLLDAQLDEDNV